MKKLGFLTTGMLALGIAGAAPVLAEEVNTNPPYQTWMLQTMKYTFHNPEGFWVRHTSGYPTKTACLADGATFALNYAVKDNVDYECVQVMELPASDPPAATW